MKGLLLSLFALAALPASAADAGQRLYASCSGCHGTTGGASIGALPALAGQDRDVLLASLRAYKAGTRSATVMQQLAKGYTDEQLVLMASYLAARPKAPPPRSTP